MLKRTSHTDGVDDVNVTFKLGLFELGNAAGGDAELFAAARDDEVRARDLIVRSGRCVSGREGDHLRRVDWDVGVHVGRGRDTHDRRGVRGDGAEFPVATGWMVAPFGPGTPATVQTDGVAEVNVTFKVGSFEAGKIASGDSELFDAAVTSKSPAFTV